MLDLRFNGLAETELPDTDARTAFFGSVYGNLGLIAGILQLVVVPLALRFVALRYIHVGIPLVHFVSSLVLTISPSLRSGTAAYMIFKALDYSVFRAAKELFYMPLFYDARYRAKQIIDSFGYRFSKGASAGVLELVRVRRKDDSGDRVLDCGYGGSGVLDTDCLQFDTGVSEISRDGIDFI